MLACQEPRFVQGLGQGGAMFASCVCQAKDGEWPGRVATGMS
jgi:hypothetical protein